MARNPDVLCAGGCGKKMWRGSGSLIPGKATCRPCRREGRGPERQVRTRLCAHCNGEFRPCDHRDRPQLTCSRACGQLARPTSKVNNAAQSSAMRRARYQRGNLARRAVRHGPILSIVEVAERDGWRCHLCRRRVDPKLGYPHPKSASRDHLIPVADGGTNAPANLALSHWDCNVQRQTGGNVQLQLIG